VVVTVSKKAAARGSACVTRSESRVLDAAAIFASHTPTIFAKSSTPTATA
jgi:hypothetical protein